MRKRFGIDIDGTVTSPNALLPFLNNDFNLQLTMDDITEYDLTHVVPVSKNEFSNWFLEKEPIIYQQSPIAKHAKEVLNEWKKTSELYFISARHKRMHDITKTWFKENGIQYDHLELVGSHKKIEAAKKLKVDIFLEDKHDNAVEICEECRIPVLLFDTPYNRKPVPDGVVRVYSWLDAKNWVNHWLNENK